MKQPLLYATIVSIGLMACSAETQQNAQATSAVAQTSSASAVVSPLSPKEQAQQLRDLLHTFGEEAKQRMVTMRQNNPKTNPEQSIELIRQEATAIRHDAERLQQLSLSDPEAQHARDLWVKQIIAFAESAEWQIQAVQLAQQGKKVEADAMNQKLGKQIQHIQQVQQQADTALNALLTKYQIPR